MNGQITVGVPAEPPHELLARMRVDIPPEIQTIFDTARARQDDISKHTKFTSSAKDELRREVEQQARVQFDAAYERVHAARQKGLDREEGQARAELLNTAPTLGLGIRPDSCRKSKMA